MPCGTGDISAPFIVRFDHLTMMDFSENMIATAKKRVPDDQKAKVDFINGDFYAHDFGESRYDLVMNIGILAHIRNPFEFLEASMKLVKPGGFLIIQNTDSKHWFAKLIHLYLGMRRAVGKDKYKLNKVAEDELLSHIKAGGFEMKDSFKYNQSFLGLSRFFSNDLKYNLTRKYFGYAGANKNASSGSDATFLFQKKAM